jgi:hypothetical protein
MEVRIKLGSLNFQNSKLVKLHASFILLLFPRQILSHSLHDVVQKLSPMIKGSISSPVQFILYFNNLDQMQNISDVSLADFPRLFSIMA